MPLQEIDFQPGINKEATDYSAKGGWVDGNLIRFRKGRVEKIGGWAQLGGQYFLGICRALHSWISLGGTKFLGIGTTWKYYAEEGDSYNDITPIRSTTSAGDVTFAATDGSSIITISDTAHGAVTNDFCYIQRRDDFRRCYYRYRLEPRISNTTCHNRRRLSDNRKRH
jgi:hypothetical protein